MPDFDCCKYGSVCNPIIPEAAVNYPREIEYDEEYVPTVGTKIERTNRATGTVTVGTVALVEGGFSDGYAYAAPDQHAGQELLWSTYMQRSGKYSFRVLVEPPRYKVGDLLTGPQLEELPVGTVVGRLSDGHGRLIYRVVVLNNELSNRYRRVDSPTNSWPRLTTSKPLYRIEYLPE